MCSGEAPFCGGLPSQHLHRSSGVRDEKLDRKNEVSPFLRRRNDDSWLECLPNMVRPSLALCFLILVPSAAWAQQQPTPQAPPDTKPARERHRIQEKEPPPPEGP